MAAPEACAAAFHAASNGYMFSFKNSINCVFDSAPTLVAATAPFLKSNNVGIPRIPYLGGVSLFSSTLSLPTVTLPSNSSAISDKIGAIILQGPHHSAQKSTKTGPLALITSASNFSSLNEIILSLILFSKFGHSLRLSALPYSVNRNCF